MEWTASVDTFTHIQTSDVQCLNQSKLNQFEAIQEIVKTVPETGQRNGPCKETKEDLAGGPTFGTASPVPKILFLLQAA